MKHYIYFFDFKIFDLKKKTSLFAVASASLSIKYCENVSKELKNWPPKHYYGLHSQVKTPGAFFFEEV